MDENEFRYDGKTFVAVEDEDEIPCTRCALWKVDCYWLRAHGEIPHCSERLRKDGRNVRFVEKGALDELKGESGGASAESTATQLALQDAEQAEARTREERDKLREEVAELRMKIERLRNDVAYWRGDAEGQKQFADAMAKELDEVNENWGKRKRELEQLSRANAELAAKNVELQEEAEWWRREAKKQEGYADALAKKNAWLTAKVAVADWRGGSGGNDAAPL